MNWIFGLFIIVILIVIFIVVLEHVTRTAVDSSKMAGDIKQIKSTLKSLKESKQKEE